MGLPLSALGSRSPISRATLRDHPRGVASARPRRAVSCVAPVARSRRVRGSWIIVLVPTDHLDDLRTQARYARERYQLYKARTLGPRSTSPQRLRELQRACEQAEARLRFAQAEEQRSRGGPGREHEGGLAPGSAEPSD